MYSMVITLVAVDMVAALSVGSPLSILQMRQSPGGIDPSQIPPQCQSTCAPLVNAFQTCSMLSCLCTNAVGSDYQACFNCFINLDPTPDIISTAQSGVAQFESSCLAAGDPVASISLVSGSGSATSGTFGPTSSLAGSSGTFGPTSSLGSSSGTLSASSVGSPVTTPSFTATPPASVGNTGGTSPSSSNEPTTSSSGGNVGGGIGAGSRVSANVCLSMLVALVFSIIMW